MPNFYVPVVDKNNQPLMPTTIFRARRWVISGKATPFWKKGIWCVRLNQEPSARNFQEIIVGIDPGSKKEGYSIRSLAHTYLNIQCDAVNAKQISKKLKNRSGMRRNRRSRNTPYRQPRFNRKGRTLPPSTRARWQLKLNIVNFLRRLYPISTYVVEDIKAVSKPGKRRWNASFSPLDVGKNWFYSELQKLGKLITIKGMITSLWRDYFGVIKIYKKLSDSFYAHCVDSWTMATVNLYLNSNLKVPKVKPDNTRILYLKPISYLRRQLHDFQANKEGERIRRRGGTRSLGFKKGSIVRYKKLGICYVGGCIKKHISLHRISTGKTITRRSNPTDCKFLCYNNWLIRYEMLI